jgi:hypothetical protein
MHQNILMVVSVWFLPKKGRRFQGEKVNAGDIS